MAKITITKTTLEEIDIEFPIYLRRIQRHNDETRTEVLRVNENGSQEEIAEEIAIDGLAGPVVSYTIWRWPPDDLGGASIVESMVSQDDYELAPAALFNETAAKATEFLRAVVNPLRAGKPFILNVSEE